LIVHAATSTARALDVQRVLPAYKSKRRNKTHEMDQSQLSVVIMHALVSKKLCETEKELETGIYNIIEQGTYMAMCSRLIDISCGP